MGARRFFPPTTPPRTYPPLPHYFHSLHIHLHLHIQGRANVWDSDPRYTRQHLASLVSSGLSSAIPNDSPDPADSPPHQHYPATLGYFPPLAPTALVSPRPLSRATRPDLGTFVPVGPPESHPSGLDPSVAAEFRLQGQPRILLRPVLGTVVRHVALATKQPVPAWCSDMEESGTNAGGPTTTRRVRLTGAHGVGKSATLLATVQWAKESGLVTWYIPDAAMFVEGGRFVPTPADTVVARAPPMIITPPLTDTDTDTDVGSSVLKTWDTPVVARQALTWLRDANHTEKLRAISLLADDGGGGGGGESTPKSKVTSGSTLRSPLPPSPPHTLPPAISNVDALLSASLDESTVPVVDAFLVAMWALRRHPQALVAVDNYGALYGRTGYGEWTSFKARKALAANQLRCVRALRGLEAEGDADLMERGSWCKSGSGSGSVFVAATR